MISFRSLCFRTATGLVLAAAAACSSAKKDDPAPETPSMSWTVDGSPVTTTTLQSQKSTSTVSVGGRATDSNGTVSYMTLEMPSALGTYTFGPSTPASGSYSTTTPTSGAVYYAGANAGAGTVTGAGTIVVTAISATSVKGTFTFTGINPNTGAAKSITNGTFFVGL
jgi:hypothetical protein